MEVLSDILSGLRTAGSVYFCDFLVPPWQLAYRGEPRAMFHLVREGRCRLEIGGQQLLLKPGDFAFISPGVDHQLCDLDKHDKRALLLCGYCEFDTVGGDLLVRALPRYMLLRSAQLREWPWLVRTLEHLSDEYMSGAPGSELTVNKLTEVLLVQLLRIDFGREGKVGLAAALQDKRLAHALAHVHQHPDRRWTLAQAAGLAAMSRSGFARRFKQVLDISFFDYLTRLRMRNARELLRASPVAVAQVAEQVGYRSELSFVKVFKKLHGRTPRAYRLEPG